MPLIKAKLLSGDTKAKLDAAIAGYKAGVGVELLTSQRAMAGDAIVEADGDLRGFVLLAHGGLDVPATGTKTADLQHLVIHADGQSSQLQPQIDAALAHVVHATRTDGNTTVAGQVTVTSLTFFASEDVGRLMTVDGVEKLITGIVDNAVSSTGSLTAVAKAAPLADGDNFTINDGVNPATVFEFQVTGGFTPVPGRVAIDIQLLTLAPEIADAMRLAIEGVGATLTVEPDDTGLALIILTNTVPGAAGNVAITEAIVGATLSPTGMGGGSDATTTAALYTGTALVSGTGKTVKLLGAEVLQRASMNMNLDRDRDFQLHVLLACEGEAN